MGALTSFSQSLQTNLRITLDGTTNPHNDIGNHPRAGGNGGIMIVDTTCAPSNIRYFQNISLLSEAKENVEKILDTLHDSADGKGVWTYRQRARKDYLKYTRRHKRTTKMTRKEQLENSWSTPGVTLVPLIANDLSEKI